MTISFEIRILDLLSELTAHTLCFLAFFKDTGTISPLGRQSVLDLFHQFDIFVQTNFHLNFALVIFYSETAIPSTYAALSDQPQYSGLVKTIIRIKPNFCFGYLFYY